MCLRLVCAITVLAAATCSAETVTYPLKLTPLSQPCDSVLLLSWSDQPPFDAGAMPKFGGTHTCFTELKLGDGKPILIAVTSGRVAETRTITVYVDTNGDRSLADEKPLAAARVTTPGSRLEGLFVTPAATVPVVYDLPGGRMTRDLTFRLAMRPEAGETAFALFVVEQAMGGSIKLGEHEVAVRLLDGDSDGKVTVADGTGESLDMVWVNPTPTKPEAWEMRTLKRYLEIGGEFYELACRADGGEITVTSHEKDLGRAIFPATDAAGKPQEIGQLYLASPQVQVLRERVHGAISLLAGSYWLVYGFGEVKDEHPEFEFSQFPDGVQIAAGEAREIRCGGPLTLSLRVGRGWAPGGVILRVAFQIRNQAGHDFQIKGREDEAPAKMVVLNAAKQIIARGDGQYGLGGGISASVRVPKAKAGDVLTIRALVDTGKYQGKIVESVQYTVPADSAKPSVPMPEAPVAGARG